LEPELGIRPLEMGPYEPEPGIRPYEPLEPGMGPYEPKLVPGGGRGGQLLLLKVALRSKINRELGKNAIRRLMGDEISRSWSGSWTIKVGGKGEVVVVVGDELRDWGGRLP